MKRFHFKHLIDFRTAAGALCQPRAQLIIRSLAFIVVTVGMIGLARAVDALPSQDQALARALENHPDIVAAKAKVALVEAELYGKRMEVSRQVIGLYGGLKMLDAQIAEAKTSIKQSKDPTAEGKLVQAMGQREQAEKELRLLIGAAPGAKEGKSANAAAIPARQTPQGPIVGDWKAAAEQTTRISFVDAPLVDVLSFLSEKTGIKFSVQGHVLEEAGLDQGMPITLDTNDVSLRAALQGFEDTYPGLQFVLRDYGVLLTAKSYAQEHGYMPVLEIVNESAGVKRR